MAEAASSISKWQVFGMYVLIVLLTFMMLIGGYVRLIKAEEAVELFRYFGYPLWLFYLTGVLEVLGAILLWIPQTRFIGAGLIILIMVVSAIHNLIMGKFGDVLTFNLTIILMAGLIAWISRLK